MGACLRFNKMWMEGVFTGRNLCSWLTLPRVDLIDTLANPKFFSNVRGLFQKTGAHHNRENGAKDMPILYKSRTAYYDILDVSGNATQSQIKTAYYKKSFCYHPDRDAGSEEAAICFAKISEAYHVLGSVSLRKKYDRGILSWEDVRNAVKPSKNASSPSKNEMSSQSEPSNTTAFKTPTKTVFDFDEFLQAHYGEQLQREQFWRERQKLIKRLKDKPSERFQFHKLSEVSAFLLLLSAVILVVSFK